jgi:hypothetical protein
MEPQQLARSVPPPDPGLCGSDRDVFLRVWRRVMPQDSPSCPICVKDPETAPAPDRETPAARGESAPAADRNCTADRNTAAAPDSGEDDFPRPDDVPCLGSAGQADRERLQQWTAQELCQWRSYQALAHRAGGQAGRTLSSLAGGCARRAKRLSAALFLLSGVRHWPAEQSAPAPRSYLGALREHFLSEQRRGCAYRAAAEDCRDACLQALYLDLADDCAEHAARIRALLEEL